VEGRVPTGTPRPKEDGALSAMPTGPAMLQTLMRPLCVVTRTVLSLLLPRECLLALTMGAGRERCLLARPEDVDLSDVGVAATLVV